MSKSQTTRWQRIESAPRDGTPVLLWHGEDCLPVVALWDTGNEAPHLRPGWYVASQYGGIGYPNESGPDDVLLASHWMPLPEPPHE